MHNVEKINSSLLIANSIGYPYRDDVGFSINAEHVHPDIVLLLELADG